MILNRQKLHDILDANWMEGALDRLDAGLPLIVVFRETELNGEDLETGTLSACADNGTNICDTNVLVDNDSMLALSGRSLPHARYQARMVKGTARANFIATGFYDRCWIKGNHVSSGRNYGPALVQVKSFVIWRSRDMELGDADDYTERGLVGDNFHGMAPFSAGCVTTAGRMTPEPTGDWERAIEWIYGTHQSENYFSAVILNHSDLQGHEKLRLGSEGSAVQKLQSILLDDYELPTLTDGIFGPHTHNQLREFQAGHGLVDDGIVGVKTNEFLGGIISGLADEPVFSSQTDLENQVGHAPEKGQIESEVSSGDV